MTTYGKSSLKTLTVCNNWRWISSKWSIANLILSKWLIYPFTSHFIWILNDSNPKFPSKIWEWHNFWNWEIANPSSQVLGPPASMFHARTFTAHLLINSLLILVEHLCIIFLFVMGWFWSFFFLCMFGLSVVGVWIKCLFIKKLEIVGICITHDDYFVPLSGLLLGCEITRGFFAIEDCSDWCLPAERSEPYC
jgi:hypothetical protein